MAIGAALIHVYEQNNNIDWDAGILMRLRDGVYTYEQLTSSSAQNQWQQLASSDAPDLVPGACSQYNGPHLRCCHEC